MRIRTTTVSLAEGTGTIPGLSAPPPQRCATLVIDPDVISSKGSA
jgi:hypothetical protein